MKSNKFSLTILLLLSLNLGLWAQDDESSSVKKLIVGTWVFDYNISSTKMKPEAKEGLESIPSDLKDKVIASYKGRRLTFNESGKYNIRVGSSVLWEANWRMDNGRIVLKDSQGFIQEFKIKSIDMETLILSPIPQEGQIIYFSDWYLKKQ